MFPLLSSRRIAATVAGAALLSLTAACGGSGDAAVCTDAQKLFADYTASAPRISGDLGKFNEATQKFSADLKTLAGKADGELAGALNDLSTTFGGFKIDPNDPAAASAAVQELSKKTIEAGTRLGNACS